MEGNCRASWEQSVAESTATTLEEEEVVRLEAKKKMKERFKSKEGGGVIMYTVRSQGGTSNTGNTARAFFGNAVVTSEILNCPKADIQF